MTNEELYFKIEEEVRKVVRERFEKLGPWGDGPEKTFSNQVATIFESGDFIARANGYDWVDGEGYPKAYWDWTIKGMKHNMKINGYAPKVREFYAQFFGE